MESQLIADINLLAVLYIYGQYKIMDKMQNFKKVCRCVSGGIVACEL